MTSLPTGSGAFRTTHWTMILEAARPEGAGAREAFAQLYLDYWPPLYSYVRRRGHASADAEDITQHFFERVLEKQALANLQQDGGKFRSFLIRAMKNFLANEWDRAHAQKRGGGQTLLSLNADEGETCFVALEPSHDATPESLFEKQWVLTLLDHVTQRLREEQPAPKAGLFEDLRLHLQGDRSGAPYADIAAKHGISEGAIKVAVHRLRHRYGIILREEIARTVSGPEEVDEELSHLIRVISQ